jgi:hypothetical protein
MEATPEDRAPTPPPSYDQTMALLGSIMEMYSWKDFKVILYDPERLKAWLVENLSQPEPDRYLDPEDPAAVGLSELTAEAEHQALMFWQELSPAEHEMMKVAFLAVWGLEGAATLPVSLR